MKTYRYLKLPGDWVRCDGEGLRESRRREREGRREKRIETEREARD